jgi:hypothetical protein
MTRWRNPEAAENAGGSTPLRRHAARSRSIQHVSTDLLGSATDARNDKLAEPHHLLGKSATHPIEQRCEFNVAYVKG